MNSTSPCARIDDAIGKLVTQWVLRGGKGAAPNAEGATLDLFWMVAVYEQLVKAKLEVES